jgi:hypothetical protein
MLPPVVRSALFAAVLAGCAQYRAYPILTLQPPAPRAALELTGVALLPDHRVVFVAEGEATELWVPEPDRPVDPAALLDVLPLQDGRAACEGRESARCDARNFRARVGLRAEPVHWIDRSRGVSLPFDVEDLAAFGPERVLGVTKYTTVGRRTGFRKEQAARSRRQTERLFVLERRNGEWYEQDLPEVTRLRDSLSDWGRANCNDDLLVEGLAWDPSRDMVYVGVGRCAGPAVKVLRYPLGLARDGLAATLGVWAEAAPAEPLGPAEGLTGLSSHEGVVYAVSAWDSYGYDTEAAFGGRVWRAEGTQLLPIPIRETFLDRPAAIAVLARAPNPDDVQALVLFDNDAEAGSAMRPNATVLTVPTAAPASGAWIGLLGVDELPDPLTLGLNGFDFRWFARDHRLAHLALVLARDPAGRPGAWTRALGGRWQVEVGGSLGTWARSLLPRSDIGRNRQAVAVTDYGAVEGLRFHRYRVRLSVVPRDRERENPSVAELMEAARPEFRVEVPLPETIAPGAGVVLQGFAIDTTARAQEGLCVAGLELGADVASPTSLVVQSTLLGGLCNDFDNRGPTLRHGRTTRPDGGVSVVLDLAVVEGVPSGLSSVAAWDRALPAPAGVDPAAERAAAALRGTTDARSRASIHCTEASEAGVRSPARQAEAPPADWLVLGHATAGSLAAQAGSLRGFSLAWDPVGFDPGLSRPHLTEAEALARNNYVYRYLARAFVSPAGTFAEAGISHGIHKRGIGRDNARPSALYARLDLTTFPVAGATAWDLVAPDENDDPNLLPEDGFVRWATPFPLTGSPTCSSRF